MKVTSYGADDVLANGSAVVASQMGFQNLNTLLHRTCSNQHLGNEDLVVSELLSYNAHSVDHTNV